MKRIISSVLALLMVMGCLSCLFTVGTAADIIGGTPITGDYVSALEAAFAQKYTSTQNKVAGDPNMILMARQYGFELYCNPFTGEVAYRNMATGEVLTSNPVNFEGIVGTAGGYSAENTITQLLSQIQLTYQNTEGKDVTIYSFVEAAARNQIVVKNIKNGIRVEYTMGRLDSTYLLPGVLFEEDFQTYILDPLDEKLAEYEYEFGTSSTAYKSLLMQKNRIDEWYAVYEYDDRALTDEQRAALQKEYPAFVSGAIFRVLDEGEGGAVARDKVMLESIIKTYCPDFTQDTLDDINARTGYVQKKEENPVFRLALEYTLASDGLTVRLPASSIRFDETKYTLRSIRMLQYFGAGNLNHSDGYVFYPDGSGALIDFGDFYNTKSKEPVELNGSIYGEDSAYYNIDEDAKHSEIIRMPVFGIVDERSIAAGKVKTGFLAILEDGDALAKIGTSFGGPTHFYASAYTEFEPRPYDSYNMSDAISVADDKEWTITSNEKYTGTYKMKYVMLFDQSAEPTIELANSTSGTSINFFEASYVGMAAAYRHYLLNSGLIDALQESEVTNGKEPLYIESFGSMLTIKKFASIPFEVNEALTTFADVKSMYDQLATKGITNINFKLTGFANGGMAATYPKKLKWVSAVGGSNGFKDLLSYAKEKDFGVYPDFDFAYSGESGLRFKSHAVRAVDDRYASKQLYDAVFQEFTSYFDICVSPNSILQLADRFAAYFTKYDPIGISVGTLGSDLNSDFNDEKAQNRESAKDTMKQTLSNLQKTYGSVMSEGGNIYALKYLDHLLSAPIDNSRYKYESRTVPFWGMVLHGYAQYAGSPINEAGDGDYELLRSIENGAALYYLLSYRNTSLLKDDIELSQYYSVRFDIWFGAMVEQYNKINGAIGDLQLYQIIDHKFLLGERVPQASELAAVQKNILKALENDLLAQYNALIISTKKELNIKQQAVSLIKSGTTGRDAILAEIAYRSGAALSDAEMAYVDEILQLHAAGADLGSYDGKTAVVYVDEAAIESSLAALLGTELTADQKSVIASFARKYSFTGDRDDASYEVASITSVSASVKPSATTTDSFATDSNYQTTTYTITTDNLVMVTYGKGADQVHFVLNYNTFDVDVRLEGVNGGEAFRIGAYGFCRINGTTLVTD